MRPSSNRGFLLLDSLICVSIVTVLCVLCTMIYASMLGYGEGYERYQERSNRHLADIFHALEECEACAVDESD